MTKPKSFIEKAREIAKAELYAPFGEKAKRKSNWEEIEAELNSILEEGVK